MIMKNGSENMEDNKWIVDILKERGYKFTEQRKAIIEVIGKKGEHYNASEIFERVGKKIPDVSFSTIYRNIELLLGLGILKKISIEEGLNHFELASKDHHHHIICKSCGYVKEIDLCPYKDIEKKRLDEIGFEPMEHKFEIYGLCKKCKNKD